MTLGKISLNIGKTRGKTSQICKNSTKTAVKVAKKPVLREKCAVESVKCASNRASSGYKGTNRHLWTAEEQLAAAIKGGKTKALKTAILDDCAKSAAKGNRIAQLYDDALNEPDPEIANQKMQLAERAAKFIGATFDQSPDAKQRVEVDGKMDNMLNVKISEA